MAWLATMKTAEIAKALSVTTNTIRNWSKQYSGHLSAGAVPPPGQERNYTSKDLSVLRYIQGCVQQGMQHTEIARRLAETTISEIEVPEPPASPAQVLESPPEALLLPLQLVQASIERFDAVQAALQRQEERLDSLERQRFNVWALAVGIAIGILLTVVATWLALVLLRPAG